MNQFPTDIYTEPQTDTAVSAHLGPLAPLAGVWEGTKGVDINPKENGPEEKVYIERIDMRFIDPQPNGPQLFYGLRYHIYIHEPESPLTFHDQIGYWLWEPAEGNLIQTVTIPRGQTAMAVGKAAADAKKFTLRSERGSMTCGIISNPFLEHAFNTQSYEITVTVNDDGTWSYEQDTVMIIPGYKEPFHHTDHNTLHKIAESPLNPGAVFAVENGRVVVR